MRNSLLIIACLLAMTLPTTSSKAQRVHDERRWQRIYCEGMQLEEHLPSGGIVDRLNDEYAIEVDGRTIGPKL
jgi:hypothetical protein